MSRLAWVYIYFVLIVAAIFGLLTQFTLPALSEIWVTFAILTFLASMTQFFEATYGRQSYYLHMVFFFAGIVLLPPPLFVLLFIVPHLVEEVKKRLTVGSEQRAWYIQPFNVAAHIIAGLIAQRIYHLLGGDPGVFSPQSTVVATMAAAAVYAAVNHCLIGQALVLARKVPWRDSGILDLGALVNELTMMWVGFVVATLWTQSPWLILPALSPLLLIYRALMVPQLKKEAQTDGKTGLWNARHFDRLFSEELDRARNTNRPLAVIMADLDLLRNINNTYGHLAGDVVLEGTAKIIQHGIRDGDFAGRFGGEEFSVVLPDCGLDIARMVAERLRETIEASEFPVSTSPTPIKATMSFGIACFPADGTTPKDLVYAADIALYQVKLNGRNAVASASNVPHAVKLKYDTQAAFQAVETSYPVATAMFAATATSNGSAAAAAAAESRQAEVGSPTRDGEQTPKRPAASAAATQRHNYVLFRPFVGAVIAVGLAIAALGFVHSAPMDLGMIGLLVVLAMIAELLQVKVYEENTVSVSMAVTFAGAIVGGIPAVTLISIGIVLIHYVRVWPGAEKLLFNWAAHVTAGSIAVLLIHNLGIELQVNTLPLLIIPTVLAAIGYYVIETGLIAIAIGLSSSEMSGIVATWRQQFRWLVQHYLVLGIMGLFLAVAYSVLGALSVVVFALPVGLMHYAQKEYVQRTEDSVREMRRMNQELALANQEISKANSAIQQLNDELFLVLAKIIDARDPYVSGHATKVADYATAIAVELGMPDSSLETVRQAGYLHDIGKIGISENILHKPAKLTQEEYRYVKSHAALGADFLETSQGLYHLAPYIRHHHEWWNGTGYPNELYKEEIPLVSRILAVSDAVEAMASDRPYKRAMTLTEIREELERFSGIQFDPAVVEAFVHVVENRGEQFVVNTTREVMRKKIDSGDMSLLQNGWYKSDDLTYALPVTPTSR